MQSPHVWPREAYNEKSKHKHHTSILEQSNAQISMRSTKTNMQKKKTDIVQASHISPLHTQELVTLIPTAANAGPTFKSTLTVLLLIASS
jgi:hypothetical protein